MNESDIYAMWLLFGIFTGLPLWGFMLWLQGPHASTSKRVTSAGVALLVGLAVVPFFFMFALSRAFSP